MADNGVICSNCGKQVQIPEDVEKCFCPYCASEVSRQVAEVSDNNVVDVPDENEGKSAEEVVVESAAAEAQTVSEDDALEPVSFDAQVMDGQATEKAVAPMADDSEQTTSELLDNDERETAQEVAIAPTSESEEIVSVSTAIAETTATDSEVPNIAVEKKKKSKKTAIIAGSVSAVVVIAVIIFIVVTSVIPGNKYAEASAAYDAGEFKTAMQGFVELGDYNDAKKRAYDCVAPLVSKEEYEFVTSQLGKVIDPLAGDYVAYTAGMKAIKENDTKEAKKQLSNAPDLPYAQFALGLVNMSEKNYSDALGTFADVAKENPSDTALIEDCFFMSAECYYAQKKMNTAKSMYKKLPLTYSFGSITVYQRLATIALVGNSDKGTWYVYKWYGTDSDGNQGVTKQGSELENWGHESPTTGEFFSLNKVRYGFDVKGIYATTDPDWVGEGGKQVGSWTVDTSDIPTDGSYEYFFDAGDKKYKLSFKVSKKGIMSFHPYEGAEEIYYLKRMD